MNPRINPFAPGAGTQPPELAGREQIIDDVSIALHRIKNGLSAKSVLIVGLRGVGKTVLLNRLKDDAEAAGLICTQFESPENRSLPAMLVPSLRNCLLKLDRVAGVGNTVSKAVKALGSFIGSAQIKYQDMEFSFDLGKDEGVADTGDLDNDLSELLQAVGTAAKDKKTAVVLFIDELQYVPEAQLAALISALHTCSQKRLPVTVVGAGLPQLVGNIGKAKSYAERLFNFPAIGPLPTEAATIALQRPVGSMNVVFDAAAIDEILKQTKGYPYFLQEWGSHAWAVASHSPISESDAKHATELALNELDQSFFRVRFDRCTPMEKAYMRSMAETGSDTPRSGDIATIMKREVTQVAPLRQSLITKGMVYSPAHGDVAFTVPLFADYMKRTMKLPA
jgi:AAA ATPase domain